MNIVIIGNVASGKSTLCRSLEKEMPGHTYLCLDDVRRQQYAANPFMCSIKRDTLAKKKLLQKIRSTDMIIYESTGVTQTYSAILAQLRVRGGVLVIKLKCDSRVCVQRFYARQHEGHFKSLPFYVYNKSINVYADNTEHKLKHVDSDLVVDSQRRSKQQCVDEVIEEVFRR